jgi:hypothetical protein
MNHKIFAYKICANPKTQEKPEARLHQSELTRCQHVLPSILKLYYAENNYIFINVVRGK